VRAQLTVLGCAAVMAAACTGSSSDSRSGATPSPPGASPSPSASSSPSASPTPSASSPAAGRTTSPRPTSRAGDRVLDVSFVSADEGWALTSRGVVRSRDGGLTWAAVGAVPPQVTHVRFASDRVGYSWGRGQLWLTVDGGSSWRGGGLTHVDQLAVGAGAVWAITGPLPGPRVWRSPVGSRTWTKLGIGPNRSATLDVHGDLAYVTGQQGAGPIAPAIAVWSAAGGDPRDEKVPCQLRRRVTPESPLGISTDGVVVVACVIQDGSRTRVRADVSGDEGRTWTPIPAPPAEPTDLTATRRGVVSWATDLLVLHAGRWRDVLRGGGYGGFISVGFVSDDFGVAVTKAGVLFLTYDGGSSWRRREA
jgi:hypothetical protein